MSDKIQPELGVEVYDDDPDSDIRVRLNAVRNTVKKLEEKGLNVEPTKEDRDVAAKITMAYADNPEKTSKKVTNTRLQAMTPAAVKMTNELLDGYGQYVVASASQVRSIVINKLLVETENPDARIRLRALELLGKTSDAAVFTDKTEVKHTYSSSEELTGMIRAKMEKIINPGGSPVVMDGVAIDVDAELGISNTGEDSDVTS